MAKYSSAFAALSVVMFPPKAWKSGCEIGRLLPDADDLRRRHHIAEQEGDVLQCRIVQRRRVRSDAVRRDDNMEAERRRIAQTRLDAGVCLHAGKDNGANSRRAQTLLQARADE